MPGAAWPGSGRPGISRPGSGIASLRPWSTAFPSTGCGPVRVCAVPRTGTRGARRDPRPAGPAGAGHVDQVAA